LGYKRIICPKINSSEGGLIEGLEIIGVNNLVEVIKYLNNQIIIEPTEKRISQDVKVFFDYDFSSIKGQKFAKRALEISAAGGHNCLLIGTPRNRKDDSFKMYEINITRPFF